MGLHILRTIDEEELRSIDKDAYDMDNVVKSFRPK